MQADGHHFGRAVGAFVIEDVKGALEVVVEAGGVGEAGADDVELVVVAVVRVGEEELALGLGVGEVFFKGEVYPVGDLWDL